MLRFTLPLRLSKSVGNGAGEWVAHRTKQSFRLSSRALQQSRQRFQRQKESFQLQQSLNQQFGGQQQYYARQRKDLEGAAYGLAVGHNKQRRQAQNARNVHVSAERRAEDLATARHLLMMKEALRKEMKRGKGRRVEAFRSAKRGT